MTTHRKAILAMVSLCLGLVQNSLSHAGSYPQKPIRMIVTAAPGGPADVPAHIAAQILREKLGQPVIVEHRPGAGGAIGAREVAKAPADGYTLLIGNTSTMAVIPAVSNIAGYDPVKDFVPIARIAEGFQVVAVHPSSPWMSIQDLLVYARANPGKLNWAHSGVGSLPHMGGELFLLRGGIKMTGISYRSGGESVNALLTQAVEVTSEGIAVLAPLVRAGKLRALAAQHRTRTKLLPDLPTTAEAGIANAEADTFVGLVAPAGTPAHIIKTLNAAMNDGLRSPEVEKLLANVGAESTPLSPEEFAAYIEVQHRKWLEVSAAAGVKIN